MKIKEEETVPDRVPFGTLKKGDAFRTGAKGWIGIKTDAARLTALDVKDGQLLEVGDSAQVIPLPSAYIGGV